MIELRRKAAVTVTPGTGELAAAVIIRRGELGLTQDALAAKAGVSVRTIRSLEAGRTWPQARSLAAIARVLGLDVSVSEPAKAAS